LILRATAGSARDHTTISLALGTGLRLAEIVGLEVGDVFAPDAPLFANQSGRRISKRRVQCAWATWQRRAGFDRVYGFHALSHSAITNVYRASRDLFLAQRVARHLSPLTTTVYTHPSDEEMRLSIRRVRCYSAGGGIRSAHSNLSTRLAQLAHPCPFTRSAIDDVSQVENACLCDALAGAFARGAATAPLAPRTGP